MKRRLLEPLNIRFAAVFLLSWSCLHQLKPLFFTSFCPVSIICCLSLRIPHRIYGSFKFCHRLRKPFPKRWAWLRKVPLQVTVDGLFRQENRVAGVYIFLSFKTDTGWGAGIAQWPLEHRRTRVIDSVKGRGFESQAAGTAGEFSSPGSTFCADSYFVLPQ